MNYANETQKGSTRGRKNPDEAGEDLNKASSRAETNMNEKIPTGTCRLPENPGEPEHQAQNPGLRNREGFRFGKEKQ